MKKRRPIAICVSLWRSGPLFAALAFLLTAALVSARAQTSCMETDTSSSVCQAVLVSNEMAPPPSTSNGIRLNHNVTNVLFNNPGYACQFVMSNASGNDYFVPQGSNAEFLDFLQNQPAGVTTANCVLPTTYMAQSTIPNAAFQIFAEGGAPTPIVAAGAIAPISPIAVPTNQSTMNGVQPAPNTTKVSVVNQASMQPLQFYYTRQDCASDPFINPPPCNTWIVRETQSIQFNAPKSAPVGTNSSWVSAAIPPVVTSTYDISSSKNGPWTPITVNGVVNGVPGKYNNDYMPPTLLSCSYNGISYEDGQTWSVAGTQSPTAAECPSGAGTRTDDMSTPYICNNGVASANGAATETGFTGGCAAATVCTSTSSTPPSLSTTWDGVPDPTYTSGEAPPIGNPSNFTLAHVSDFTKPVDSSWNYFNEPPSGSTIATYVSSECSEKNGAMQLATANKGGGNWVSCGMYQGIAQTYGKYLIRFRADLGDGMSPTAVLSSPTGATGALDFIFENWNGTRGQMQGTDFGMTGDWFDTPYEYQDYTTQWHTMGVEWTPNSLVYTIDGTVWSTLTSSEVMNVPMNLNLRQELTFADGNTPSPSNFDVNWVAEYSYTPSSVSSCAPHHQ